MRQVFAYVELPHSTEELRPLHSCLEYQLCGKWVNHPVLKTLLHPIPWVVKNEKGNFLKGGRVPGFKIKCLEVFMCFSVNDVKKALD